MKKKWMTTLSALCMSIYFVGVQPASAQVAAEAATVQTEGVLPVCQRDGKVFLKLPRALEGRELFISAQIDKGFDLIGRPAKTIGVVRVRIQEDQKQVLLEQPFYAERILDEQSELIPAFGASNYQLHGQRLPLAEVLPDGTALVDVTELLTTGSDWFEYRYAAIRGLDGSKSKVMDVKALSDGVHFTIQRQHGYDLERSPLSSAAMMLPGSSLPLQVSCVVRVLPEEDMAIRLAGSESPFQVIQFCDYAQDPFSTIEDSLVLRWRMEPAVAERAACLKGKPVRPKQALVFAIDGYLPEVYVKAVEEAVGVWNKAFEQAGFKHALQTRRLKRDEPTAGERALIAYDMGEAGVTGTFSSHPRTGEILQARINIGHGFLPARTTAVEWLNDTKADDATLMRAEVSKVIGEMLGLRPRKQNPLTPSVEAAPDAYAVRALVEGYRPFLKARSAVEDRECVLRYLAKHLPAVLPAYVERDEATLSAYGATLKAMEKRFAKLGNDAAREYYRKGLQYYGECLEAVAGWIGSNRPAAEQKEAMRLLGTYLFRGSEAFQNREAESGGMEDRRFHVNGSVKKVFEHLFAPETQTALVRAGWYAADDNVFSADTFYQQVYTSLFQNFSLNSSFSYEQLDRLVQGVEAWKKALGASSADQQAGIDRLKAEWEKTQVRLQEMAEKHTQEPVRDLCEWMTRS